MVVPLIEEDGTTPQIQLTNKVKLFTRVLRQGTYEERFRILHMLDAHKNDPRTAMLLLLALEDPEPVIRGRALNILGCHQTQHFKPRIIKLLNDPHPDIRRTAVELLGKLHDPDVVKSLVEALRDRNRWVRWAAVEAVSWCEADFVAEALRPLINDPEAMVRRRVCEAFTKLKPVPVVEILDHLTDEDEWVRFWGVQALQTADDPWAIPGIISCLNDPSDVVFTRAARALGYLRATDAIPYLEDALMRSIDKSERITLLLSVLKHINTPQAEDVLDRWWQTQHSGAQQEQPAFESQSASPDLAPIMVVEEKKHKKSMISRLVNFLKG